MNVKLVLTEHLLEFLSLKGGCRGSSESTLVKMPHCWKSHATAQIVSWFVVCYTHTMNTNLNYLSSIGYSKLQNLCLNLNEVKTYLSPRSFVSF